MIELCIQTFTVDAENRVVETGVTRYWLEQPSVSIPPEITRHAGITDADFAGKCFSGGEAYAMLVSADAILAHNAGFDRPFVDRRLELPARLSAACAISTVRPSHSSAASSAACCIGAAATMCRIARPTTCMRWFASSTTGWIAARPSSAS
jgi:hypothetical protein